MSLSVGQNAPLFTLIDTEKQPVSLESFRGQQVLLLFFPAAFSGTCTQEMCSARDDLAYFNNANCKVIAISTDAFFTLAKFKEINNLNFTLLSDYNKEVCGLYGAQYSEWIHGMKGTAKRSAFVIDEKGIIKYAEVLEKAGDLPDFENIKKAIG